MSHTCQRLCRTVLRSRRRRLQTIQISRTPSWLTISIMLQSMLLLSSQSNAISYQNCKTTLNNSRGGDYRIAKEPDYVRFVNLLSNDANGDNSSFEDLPEVIQVSYNKYAGTNAAGIDVSALQNWAATQSQINFLKNLCADTEAAIQNANGVVTPSPTTKSEATTSKSGIPFLPFDCSAALTASDSGNNNFLGPSEYASFINTLLEGKTNTQQNEFDALPGILQFNFNNLSSGGQIDTFGASSASQWNQASRTHRYSYIGSVRKLWKQSNSRQRFNQLQVLP